MAFDVKELMIDITKAGSAQLGCFHFTINCGYPSFCNCTYQITWHCFPADVRAVQVWDVHLLRVVGDLLGERFIPPAQTIRRSSTRVLTGRPWRRSSPNSTPASKEVEMHEKQLGRKAK